MDNKFFTFMGKLADLILLNLLFIICCIPIVTIGASITAMYYVTLKMVRNEESYLFRSFFKSFKQNLKQSTVIWLILLAVSIVLWMDFRIMGQAGDTGILRIVSIGLYFILLIDGMIFAYIFPLLSKFDNTIKNTFKNSLLMAIRHFPYTVLILAVTFIPMFLTLNYGLVMLFGALVWLFLGFSLTAFINSTMFVRIYDQYIPKEEENEWELDEEATDSEIQ